MNQRLFASTANLAFTLAFVSLAPAPVAGQARPAAPKHWTAPRTPDGHPPSVVRRDDSDVGAAGQAGLGGAGGGGPLVLVFALLGSYDREKIT